MVIRMVNESKATCIIKKKCQIFLQSYYTIYRKISEISARVVDVLKYLKQKKKIFYKNNNDSMM